MRSRRLIIGSGIAAGLSANLPAESQQTDLVWKADARMSPIPELVPRRAFFDGLGVGEEEEGIAVSDVASAITDLVWIDGGERITRRLASNDDFLVYDKGRLATWLRQRALAAQLVSVAPDLAANLQDYASVLDCRGSEAVSCDKNYRVVRQAQARTACTYVILARPLTVAPAHMVFWSVTDSDGALQTFFAVPVGGDAISIGCSHSAATPMEVDTVLAAARAFGMPVALEQVRFSGHAVPHIDTAMSLAENVRPIGEAARRSCPLTEYGVMVALSQLLQLAGKPALPASALSRPTHSQIDPHLPREFFL
jgi:hypothetical protein